MRKRIGVPSELKHGILLKIPFFQRIVIHIDSNILILLRLHGKHSVQPGLHSLVTDLLCHLLRSLVGRKIISGNCDPEIIIIFKIFRSRINEVEMKSGIFLLKMIVLGIFCRAFKCILLYLLPGFHKLPVFLTVLPGLIILPALIVELLFRDLRRSLKGPLILIFVLNMSL